MVGGRGHGPDIIGGGEGAQQVREDGWNRGEMPWTQGPTPLRWRGGGGGGAQRSKSKVRRDG